MNDEQMHKLSAHEHVNEGAPKPRYQNEIVLAGMVVAEMYIGEPEMATNKSNIWHQLSGKEAPKVLTCCSISWCC